MLNTHAINTFIDGIQKCFTKISRDAKMYSFTIKRWHQDVPEMHLTWQRHCIYRQIVVLIDEAFTTHLFPIGSISIDAWFDITEGTQWVRHWAHEERGQYCRIDPLAIWRAYEAVSSWTAENCTTISPIHHLQNQESIT